MSKLVSPIQPDDEVRRTMMDRSTWEKLGDELLALDRWKDFDDVKTQTKRDDPKTWIWRHIDPHPVNIMVNGVVPLEHFETYVPTLLRALDELTVNDGLEMVVRALSKKGMSAATERLVKFYFDEKLVEPKGFLWAVGNAIYTIAPRDHLEECIRIARDGRLGNSRQMLIVHLSRFKKSEEVFKTLVSLLDDESVRGAALEALKRLGDIRAIPAIEKTPVRETDDGAYERHQKEMGLKKLNEKKRKLQK